MILEIFQQDDLLSGASKELPSYHSDLILVFCWVCGICVM